MLNNVLLCIPLFLSSAFSLNTFEERPTVISEIKGKTDFRFMLPENKQWKVEVKYPYPLDLSESITLVRLHYFDSNGNYVAGIEQHRAQVNKITREEIIIDVKNKKERINKVEGYFTLSQRGEPINLNDVEARFEAWANHDKGGILRWVNDGTYLEMDSARLTKNDMIDWAKSME